MDAARLADLAQRLEWVTATARRQAQKSRQISNAGLPRIEANWWFTTDLSCPLCQSGSILRSHRRDRLEYLLAALALPFRCDHCGIRFFVMRSAL